MNLLLWIYLINAILIITHEIDSATWEKWGLFIQKNGTKLFLLTQLPLQFFIIYGLVLVTQQKFTGLIFSLVLGLAGIFIFFNHIMLYKKGETKINGMLSLVIFTSILVVSILQVGLSIYLLK